MDTISRENNSYLPIGGVIVGVLALALSGVALGKLATANKKIDVLTESMTKIEPLEGEVRTSTSAAEQAKSAADRANATINKVANDTSTAFQQVATEMGSIRGDIAKIQSPAPKIALVKGKGENGEKMERVPVVAGPDEYVIKQGDSGSKIAKAHGETLADLQAVNPSVDLSKVKPGQKIKLPAKK